MASRASPRSGRGADALAAAIIVVTLAAPTLIGSVHPATQLGLAVASLLIAGGYLVHRGERGVRLVTFAVPAAIALAVTLLQLVPLPAPLVAWLSPVAHELRAETTSASMIPLTVDVPATSLALLRGITCISLLLVVAGYVSTRRRARTLLMTIALGGAALAALGTVERLVGAKKIFWIYAPHSQAGAGFFGSFVDVNHAASLFSLSALIAIGLGISSRAAPRALMFAAALSSIVGLMLTGSRAGLLGFFVGGFLLTLVLVTKSNGWLRGFVGATVLVMATGAATLWANEGLRARVLAPAAQLHDNQKVRGWIDGMKMAAAYPITGVGRGAFEAPINAYRVGDQDVRLVYPENVIVQMASEWGFIATAALFALLLMAAARLLPLLGEARPGVIAASCGLVAVAVHELADFGLETLGVAVPAVVALGVVVGASSMRVFEGSEPPPRGRRLSRAASAALLATMALLVAFSARASQQTLEADYNFFEAQQKSGIDRQRLAQAIARHPADDFLELLAARAELQSGGGEAMHHINRALRLHPANWQAHRLAARVLAATHHPDQAALEYRLAIDNGLMPDMTELVTVLGARIVDAVPQTPARLTEWARALYAIGRQADADTAARRAVEISKGDEQVRAARVKLAFEANADAALHTAAQELARRAQDVASYELAARALAKAHDQAAANETIEAGLRAHPTDGSLLIVGAELRLAAGDVVGARRMLTRSSKAVLTLPQRQHAEELLGDVAERAGDSDTALIARTRARLIAKQLRDMTY